MFNEVMTMPAAVGTRRADRLGLLLLVWLIAAALALMFVATELAPAPGDHSDLRHRLDNLMPADPGLWSQFTA